MTSITVLFYISRSKYFKQKKTSLHIIGRILIDNIARIRRSINRTAKIDCIMQRCFEACTNWLQLIHEYCNPFDWFTRKIANWINHYNNVATNFINMNSVAYMYLNFTDMLSTARSVLERRTITRTKILTITAQSRRLQLRYTTWISHTLFF